MKRLTVIVSMLLFFSMIGNANSAQVVFTDGVFNDADRTLTTQTLVNGGTIEDFQSSTGGNPGEFRQIKTTVNAGGGSGVWGFFNRSGAIYDPAVQGAIWTIDYSEDAKYIDGTFLVGSEGQATGCMLLQGGTFYWNYMITTIAADWHTLESLSLIEDDFRSLNSINDHPDFSANGEPINFGLFRANGTTGSAYFIEAGIDNWSVTVNPVPIPGTIWLFTSGIIVFAGLRRRFKK